MILEFSIKNFKSFKGQAEFSFLASDSDFKNENYSIMKLKNGDELRVLNSAAIYGANASGKSNLIWAFSALKHLIIHSRRYDLDDKIHCYEPFLFQSETKSSPIEFSLLFIVDFEKYRYDIKFTHDTIIHEKLTYFPESKELLLFERKFNENTDIHSVIWGDSFQSKGLKDEVLRNQLYLSVIGNEPQNQIIKVFSFFKNMQVEPVGDSISMKIRNEQTANEILRDENALFKQLVKMIKISDIGIVDIKMKERSEDDFHFPKDLDVNIKKEFLEQNKWNIRLVHRNYDGDKEIDGESLSLDQESTGTKNLFGLGARILNILDKGGVMIYDELNTTLHPLLFQLLVNLFHDKISNPHHAQLLTTTHDVSIISNAMMRADQVWFCDKNKFGVSELFSAQDFDDVDISVPFDSWYRSGRFGALPKFGQIEYIFEGDEE